MEKKNFESAKNYLCSVTVKSNDTQQESCRKDIGNYKYVYVICKNGKISFSKINVNILICIFIYQLLIQVIHLQKMKHLMNIK